MPDEPRSDQPRPDGGADKAKTPDELQREGEELQRRASDVEPLSDPDAAIRGVNADERRYDEENALGDALMEMVGADPRNKPDFDEERHQARLRAGRWRDHARDLRRQAEAKLRDAAWARRALAGALLTFGALLTVGGVAGAGNTSGGSSSTTPAPTSAGTAARTGAPTGTVAAGANRPPVVGPIVAVLSPPNTSYTVQASDPDGQTLKYTWMKTNPCGTFTFTNNVAVWGHPHPPCGDETSHPGLVYVNVSDGITELQRVYTQGSLAGTGNVPPSPSAFPTTTTRGSTPTATSTATIAITIAPFTPSTVTVAASGSGGPNLPLLGGGLILLGAGGAVAGGVKIPGGGPLGGGGPMTTTKDEPKRNCDRERAEEERTRREMERAKAAYDDINQTRTARDFARDQAARADRAWQQAQHGAALGEDPVTHEPLFGSSKKSQAAKQAYEARRDAQDEARRRQDNYDGKGGDAAWQRTKDAYDAATRAHDAAAAALARCEESIAPPPAPEPPPPPPPATGGGTTTGPGGPTVATGGGSQTQERRCRQGDRRNERSSSREFKFNELNRAAVCLDSNYPNAVDPTYVEEFMDWLGTVRDTFKAGKTIKSFMGGELVEGGLDLVDFPDFYTYFDKMTDELRKSMDRLVGIMRGKAKTGDWYLRYSRQVYTVTCTTFEECDGTGNWVAGRAMKAERTATERNKQTNKIQVDDPSEVQGVLDRLFNTLIRENDTNERSMKEFQRTCGQ